MTDAPRLPASRVTSVTIDEVLTLAGRLDDEPGFDAPRERFRRFLQSHLRHPKTVRAWIEQCQHSPGDQHQRALQDLVVMLGRFLGFETTFGPYAVLSGALKLEGQWRSRSRLQVIVEMGTGHGGGPGLETLIRSVTALAATSSGSARPAGLLILASSYVSQHKIDETIAAASSTHPIGVVTLKALLSLAEMAADGDVLHEDVLRLIESRIPADFVVTLLERRRVTDSAASAPGDSGIAESPAQPGYWIAPVGPDHATRPEEFLELVVGKRRIFGLTAGRSPDGTAQPGDGLCFYLPEQGIVGHARVIAPDEDGASLRDAHRFRQLLHLDDIKLYLDAPVTLDPATDLKVRSLSGAGAASRSALLRVSPAVFAELTEGRETRTAPAATPMESLTKRSAAPAARSVDVPVSGPARRRR
jgi:hypothetical protein